MTRNRLSDLNDHRFAMLARLSDPDLTAEQMEAELARARGVVSVADAIAANAHTQLAAAKLFASHGAAVLPMLPQIGNAAARGEGGGDAP